MTRQIRLPVPTSARDDLEQACFMLEAFAALFEDSRSPKAQDLARGTRRHVKLWRERYELREFREAVVERTAQILDGSLLCDGCQDQCREHMEHDCGLPLRDGGYCHCGEKADIIRYHQARKRGGGLL